MQPTSPATPSPVSAQQRVGSRVLAATVGVFVAASSAAYVLVDLAGVNLPRYYPVLHVFSVEPIKDQIAMGFYSRCAAAFIAGLAVAAIYLLLSPLLRILHLVRTSQVTVVVSTVVWFAIATVVTQQWHEWGLVKRGLDTTTAVNGELVLFIVVLVGFCLGVVLTAGAVRRVAALNPPARDDER